MRVCEIRAGFREFRSRTIYYTNAIEGDVLCNCNYGGCQKRGGVSCAIWRAIKYILGVWLIIKSVFITSIIKLKYPPKPLSFEGPLYYHSRHVLDYG